MIAVIRAAGRAVRGGVRALAESHPCCPQLLTPARLPAGLLQGCFGSCGTSARGAADTGEHPAQALGGRGFSHQTRPPEFGLRGCEGVLLPQSDGRTAVAACADTQLLDARGGPRRTVVDSIRMLLYCVLPT